IYTDVSEALQKEDFENVTYVLSGKPVLDSSLRTEMQSNMQIMIALALVVMFIILLAVFHVRWRVLSLGVIFVSVIATLGFMGIMSVPMTMVSMAVFPILIGLGIDYSIQLQNRYEEEKSVSITLSQIGKSLFIAVLATVLGFISLYASPVPMIKDFGKMLTIGVVISFIGSIFLLMPILRIRDTTGEKIREHKDMEEKETRLDRALQGSTRFVLKYSAVLVIFAIALAGFGFSIDNKIAVETDIETFMPQDMEALQDIHKVRDVVGSTNQMAIYMEGENLLTEENVEWMDQTTAEISKTFENKVVDVKSISTLVTMMSEGELEFNQYVDVVGDIPAEQKKMFLNEDNTKSVILLNVAHMSTDELQQFVTDLDIMVNDAPMDVVVTGKSVLDVEMVKGLTEGRVTMTIIGLGLVFGALLVLYRNIVKAFIPIFPIILIIGMSAGIMYLLGISYTPITATLGALVLGMGTEMTIMLLERYIEERALGKDKMEAILKTVTKIGKATLASGLTTIGGFSVLMASQFEILKDFGLMTVINISLALISTFIILPIIIVALDRFIVKEKKVEELKEQYVN
ncbi:MAG: RND family transporter, partial [Clostridium sp.]|nr:RND family transporter [Clostridium sp.]